MYSEKLTRLPPPSEDDLVVWTLPNDPCTVNDDLSTRGFRIEAEMQQSRIGGNQSRYFEETPVSRNPHPDGTPGAVFHDCLADGECAYRAVILGLKLLEEGTASTAVHFDRVDNATMLEKVKSLKSTMFENMMLAITGVRLHPELDPAERVRESPNCCPTKDTLEPYSLMSLNTYGIAAFTNLST